MINFKSEFSKGVKTIVITGENNKLMKEIEKIVAGIVVLGQKGEKNAAPEYEQTINNNVRKRKRGRPMASCFSNGSKDYREKMINAVGELYEDKFISKKGCLMIEGQCYSKESFCACLSMALIPRNNNQTDFVRFLNEAGITVEYRSFIKVLDLMVKQPRKKYIKLGDYLNEFFELDASEKML